MEVFIFYVYLPFKVIYGNPLSLTPHRNTCTSANILIQTCLQEQRDTSTKYGREKTENRLIFGIGIYAHMAALREFKPEGIREGIRVFNIGFTMYMSYHVVSYTPTPEKVLHVY